MKRDASKFQAAEYLLNLDIACGVSNHLCHLCENSQLQLTVRAGIYFDREVFQICSVGSARVLKLHLKLELEVESVVVGRKKKGTS